MYQTTNQIAIYLLLFTLRNVIVAADPNVITKSEWNGVEASNELTRQSLPVGRVVILHTAGIDCADVDICSQQVRNIQHFHMQSFNFDDIAYNFLIGNDGNVYEGRGWDYIGAAIKNYNVGGLSLAFMGTFVKTTPSAQALDAAQSLLEMGVRTSKLIGDYKLFGHRQLSPTESPGAALYEIIKQWPHWSRSIS
ncbi:peptidoglycan-recognition protein SD-like [Anastrepha obliqua]|uniref:peptidoglycan-recognition protein SD-like n=1 Tax=Anastrepha obliqua TaxID=95512 RepID=UPI0024099028|nr:peptidoglycan-recognition protein SD-like [Anastrepha obliqua]XP_054734023.1 peptidoglycan-recognition protein SD-like [Anastrepha obliqua]XP_054734024.1 peptidoglycan-recognition protein SD-like [Anastrepha obliqua]